MGNIITEGQGNIPTQPVLILPNRIDLQVVKQLEEQLGNGNICWLVEDSHRPGAEIMNYLNRPGAHGLLCSAERMSREVLSDRIHDALSKGLYVVLICGRPGQQPSSLSDVPANILSMFDDTTLSALPLYAGMYNKGLKNAIVTQTPYDTLRLQYSPVLKAGAGLGVRVLSAWAEAAAVQFSAHPQLTEASLPHALLHSMKEHPDALIIDGVDDTQMTRSRLLALALILSRRIRSYTTERRIGVILPPGKLATITNVACILAGIAPVNINYTADAETFRNRVEKARLTRFITEQRFISKQQQFAWPRRRDLLFADRELSTLSNSRLRAWQLLVRFAPVDKLAVLLHIAHPQPGDEAAISFSDSVGSTAKGVVHTHAMILAGAMQMQSRLQPAARERFLCTAPLYTTAGFTVGLLMPLLYGCDMITYPSPDAGKRICRLAHNYGATFATFSPGHLHRVLQHATADTFATARCIMVTDGKLPEETSQKAAAELKLNLQEAYTLSEAACICAASASTPEPAPGTPHIIPTRRIGSVGAPMPGIAVRITDSNRDDLILPASSPGNIWLQGPAIASGYLADTPPATERMRGKWFRTDDVGCMDANGILTICGRRERFSKISGEMVSHEMVEAALCRILGIAPGNETPRLAILGVPGPKGERLVMLSTIHKTGGGPVVTPLRYQLTNAHYSGNWAPEVILPMPYIPTLPNGKLDYETCYRGACRTLGVYPE